MRQYVESVQNLFDQDEQDYISIISEMSAIAKSAKEELLQKDLTGLKKTSLERFTWKMIELFRSLVFFPDEEIIRKFKQYNLGPTLLKWFTPLEKIDEEFNLINSRNQPGIFKAHSMRLIKLHFDIKISSALLGWSAYSKDKLPKNLKKIILDDFKNRFKRREYHQALGQEMKMKQYEKLINNQIDILLQFTKDEKKTKGLLIDLINGRSETFYISQMVQFYLDFEMATNFTEIKNSERFMLSIIYNLCRLILKDTNLLTEKEFENLKNSIYDSDFTRYRAKKLKTILKIKRTK